MIRILLICLILSGCAVTANKQGDKMVLRGWGAKSAKWNIDGSSEISKEEPIRVPDIAPIR